MRSAGLLPYRTSPDLAVLIAHPGGPFFAGRDEGVWTILKGIVEEGESPEQTALREFKEETGWEPPTDYWLPLGETIMRSRKVVLAWAFEGDFDPSQLDPGTFTLHGREYPEIDRVMWASPEHARRKLNPALVVLVDRLVDRLGLNERRGETT